jgi:hypothetical protein
LPFPLAAKSEARRVEAAAAEQLSAMAADLKQAMAAEASALADMQRARAAEAARSQQLAEAEEQLLQVGLLCSSGFVQHAPSTALVQLHANSGATSSATPATGQQLYFAIWLFVAVTHCATFKHAYGMSRQPAFLCSTAV